jgi:hypothetical protein
MNHALVVDDRAVADQLRRRTPRGLVKEALVRVWLAVGADIFCVERLLVA